MKKNEKILALAVILTLLFLIGFFLCIRQPWGKKRMVLSIPIPNSKSIVELWEARSWNYGLLDENETWFVIRSPNGKGDWYLIDAKYLEFGTVAVFISSDHSKIRVETTGINFPSHMIAEYDLNNKTFRAESEWSVKGKEGWILLKEKVVR
jgi:hypothetical protein